MRVALSILAGFAVIQVLVVAYFLAAALALGEPPAEGPPELGPGFFAGAILWGVLAAAAGAYVAGRLSRGSPLGTAGGLVALCWLVGLASLVATDGREPLWFSLSHFGALLVGSALGAGLCLRSARSAAPPVRTSAAP